MLGRLTAGTFTRNTTEPAVIRSDAGGIDCDVDVTDTVVVSNGFHTSKRTVCSRAEPERASICSACAAIVGCIEIVYRINQLIRPTFSPCTCWVIGAPTGASAAGTSIVNTPCTSPNLSVNNRRKCSTMPSVPFTSQCSASDVGCGSANRCAPLTDTQKRTGVCPASVTSIAARNAMCRAVLPSLVIGAVVHRAPLVLSSERTSSDARCVGWAE